MLLLISLYSSAMSGSSLSISRWLSMMLRSSLWAGPVWADTGDKWCTFSAVSSINGSIALNGRPWDERRCSQMEYIWLLKLHAKTADMCRYFLCSDEASNTWLLNMEAVLISKSVSSLLFASIKKCTLLKSTFLCLLNVCIGYSTPYQAVSPFQILMETLPAVCTNKALGLHFTSCGSIVSSTESLSDTM